MIPYFRFKCDAAWLARLKAAVPKQQRSQFVRRAVEMALEGRGKAVEGAPALDWDAEHGREETAGLLVA